MDLFCPIDKKDDSIQKASAVVAGGQSFGSFSGPTGGTVAYDGKTGNVSGYATLSGNSSSRLSQLLAPPPEPAKPSGFGCWWILLWYPTIPSLGVMLGFITVSPILAILGVLWQYVLFPNSNLDLIGVIPAGGVVGIFVGSYFVYRYFKGLENKKKAREEVRYSEEKLIWDKLMQKWDRLYYCHKHDIVFDPENGESCAPSLLKEFLNQSRGGYR